MKPKAKQSNGIFSVASKTVVILITVIWGSCANSKEEWRSPITMERIKTLSSAKSFNDVFVLIDSVQLEVSPQSLITYLAVVAVDANGRIAVSDSRQSQVLIFSDKGKFLKLIASKGSGPGEVARPYGLAFFRDGSLVVVDVGNNRINMYSGEGDFKHSFLLKSFGPSRVMLDSIGNIFVQASSHPGGAAIQKYDRQGKLVDEFGEVPEIGRKIGTPIRGGNFTKYRDSNIYYVHPTEYLIHQFKLDGEKVRVIEQQSNRCRPLRLALVAADPQSFRKWQQSWDPLHTVIATNEGFLLAIYQSMQASLDTVTNVVDLYDVEGKLIAGDIPTSFLPVCVDDQNTIYCLNQKLRFVQENPILFRFKIRAQP